MKFFKNIFNKPRPTIKADNSSNPFNYKFEAGIDCDENPNSYGEFGKTSTNPIPVNGPKGEAIYFNNIRTTSNKPLIYHRLTSIKKVSTEEAVDVFEVVSSDGKYWDILYFDMYHPRNSNKFPNGFMFSEYDKIFSTIPFGIGLTNFHASFPESMEPKLKRFPKPFNTLGDSYLKLSKDIKYIRPQEHFLKVMRVNNAGNFFNQLSDFIAFHYPTEYFINLLMTNDHFGQIAGLKCLSRIPSELLKPYINDVCDFASRIEDDSTNELCVALVEKVSPNANEFYGLILDFLDKMNNSLIALTSLQSMIPTTNFSKLAIPYLIKIKNHKFADIDLKKYCDTKIEELRYE